MATITAIELGDTCTLARASVHGGQVHVLGVETLDRTAFPNDETFTSALRQARKERKMPRRARVVAWGLPEGSTSTDAGVKPLLAPLAQAGFRVERVVSPCNALAALARVRVPRGEGAICWLAVNRGGVAIVVVRPGRQLYAHSFPWDWKVGASGSQARLLQRYSLVSYLSPEVKRAMAEARTQGTPVDVVVTCGNLPDLRSLTMPLIEELDVEVETLDSLDGLVVRASAAERAAEVAPAIRLACAGAFARGTRPRDEAKRRAAHRAIALIRAAAVLAGIALLAFGWRQYGERRPEVGGPRPEVRRQGPEVRGQGPEVRGQRPEVEGRGPTAPLNPPQPAADTPPASSAGVNPAAAAAPAVVARPLPPLLTDPMPRVTAILVANDRRFATIDGGKIIGVRDVIGRRIVVEIEEKAIVLREPSGVLVRVGLGGRVLGTEWGR